MEISDLKKYGIDIDPLVCVQCGYCRTVCPIFEQIPWESASPRGKLFYLKELVRKGASNLDEDFAKRLFQCTLCGRCEEVCQLSIRTEDMWRKVRATVYEAGKSPEPIMAMDGGLAEKQNPYGSDAFLRDMWTDFMDDDEIPADKETAHTIFFVGCTSALKAQCQDIPAAVARILNCAGEDWTFIGEDEVCCGSPNMMVGNLEKARDLARQNTEQFEARGAKRIVTNCPGCYRALTKYSEMLGRKLDFEVLHFTELVSRYLKEGRIKVKEKFKEKIIYHDPCELGRLSGICEDPRAILKAITDQPVDFPENRADSQCCGGGGLLMAVDGDLRLRIGENKARVAKEMGAEIMTSACPSCKMVLDDAAKELKTGAKVFDIMELLAQKLADPDEE